MKKIEKFVGAAALLAATLVPAFAAGNSCTNSTTGPSSNNTCSVTNTNTATVNNVNDAIIRNTVTAFSNTGNNSASNNTLGGNVTTGNASLNATVSSVANVNTTNLTVGMGSSSNSGINEITGPFSNNDAFVTNTRTANIWNSNTASVNNVVNATADTGSNRADNNTGPAVVRSGSASLGVNVLNHVNDSLTAVALGSGGTGNNTAGNSTTGPSSNNTATVTNTSDATVNNVNDLIINNIVDVLANTGRNRASNNTLGADITTGNAAAGVGVDNEGNINTTQVAMALGGFSQDASNGVTGPFSNNDTFLTNTNTTLVENWNNKCRSHNAPINCDPTDLGVFNVDNDVADSGSNIADNNTGGGDVIAGWASLWKNLLTHLNDSLTVIGQ